MRACLVVNLAWMIFFTASGLAAEPDESKLSGFAPFIGTWAFTDQFLAENEWAKDFHAEVLEWGAKKNIVRMRETAHKTDRNRVVFEGFAYWHPSENRLKYVGYNVQERFFFDGEIVELGPSHMIKQYKVFYPPGYAHGAYSEIKGNVREYRGERRLLDASTLELTTLMKIGGQWARWPTPDAKPFVIRKLAEE